MEEQETLEMKRLTSALTRFLGQIRPQTFQASRLNGNELGTLLLGADCGSRVVARAQVVQSSLPHLRKLLRHSSATYFSEVIHKSTELLQYDDTWEFGPELPTEVSGHCVTPLTVGEGENTFVLLGGGNRDVRSYNFGTSHWESHTSLPASMSFGACAPFTTDAGDNIIVYAGNMYLSFNLFFFG